MKKLITLAVCLLLSLSALAEPRLIVATSNNSLTDTRIHGGVTADDGLTYDTIFSAIDALTIGGTIEPPGDILGEQVSIYKFLNIVGLAWFQMDTQGVFILWDGNFDNLVPALLNVTLEKQTDVTIIENLAPGLFGLAGLNYEIHFGYSLNSNPDAIIFNGSPMVANVVAMEESETYYVKNIKDIVNDVCVGCHDSRGDASNSAIQYEREFNANHLSLNYDILSSYILDEVDGAALILSKPTGGNDHGGGEQLDALSAEMDKLSNFVQLLLAESE